MRIKWRNYQVLELFCSGAISLEEAAMLIKTNRTVSIEKIRISLLRFFDLRSAENVGNVEDDLVADLYSSLNA